MQKTLRVRATVQPGGRIEIVSPELQAGQTVDVVVINSSASVRRSVVDILDEAPGQLLFKSAQEVDDYLAEERASWD